MKNFGNKLKRLKKWFERAPKPTPRKDAAADRDWPEDRAARPAPRPASTTASPPGKPRPEKKAAPQTPRSADTPIAVPSVSGRPLSRRGIPILKPDEDLAAHFSDAARDHSPRQHAAARKVRSGKSPTPSLARGPEARVRRNRVGIRRLADDADLRDYFKDAPNEAPAPQAQPASKRPHRSPATDLPTDRHGIPRLDNGVDLNRLFGATADDTAPEGDLGEALRQSLAHDARGLMKRKTGGFFPTRRLTLKERLRRYPPPQAQLDLHGDSALIARQRAEAFIRTARAEGLFTLRIIVGKGLHSTDGAVLPDVIEDLTVALKRQKVVLAYRWEKRIKRKSGALIVYLVANVH